MSRQARKPPRIRSNARTTEQAATRQLARLLFIITTALIITASACTQQSPTPEPLRGDNVISEHMEAQAMLTAHFIDAAIRAELPHERINAVLTQVARETLIDEFWITDETGAIIYTNRPDIDFTFPEHHEEDSQAAPFVRILTQNASVVTQPPTPRDRDGAVFKYVAVAGIDQKRIVQIGIETHP